MKVFTSVAGVFFIFASSALAQESNSSKAQGYVFFALGPGNVGLAENQKDIHVGAGGEGFISKGLGFGAELGPLGPLKPCSSYQNCGAGWSDWAIGLGSANFSHHFLPSTTDGKFEPFVTGGYSLFFRHGTSSGINGGGGVNVWMNKNAALRFEGRVHLAEGYHLVNFRVGVTFR